MKVVDITLLIGKNGSGYPWDQTYSLYENNPSVEDRINRKQSGTARYQAITTD